MKCITLLIAVVLLLVGCGKPIEEEAVGTYERKGDLDTYMQIEIFPLEGLIGRVKYGTRHAGKENWGRGETTWFIVEGEICIMTGANMRETDVYTVNKDGSITLIAQQSEDHKRTDIPKDKQITFKKIK